MRNYKHLMIATGFALLVGCQTQMGGDWFLLRPSDAAITTAVHENIVHDPNLSRSRIHVETMNGNVVLTGHVRTIRQSDMAAEIATKTAGVRTVQNNLIVRRK